MSEPAVISAGGLTLIRTASGGQRIELGDSGAPVTGLESIEPGDAASADSANWPASPPVQEWHDETRVGGAVLMAVGRAGRSHWSLSCEVAADGRLTFDVAARISEPPERLGSSYRLSGGTALRASAGRLQLAGGWQLTVDPLTTHIRYDATTRTLIIAPIATPAANWPQTIRWTYGISRQTS